MTKKKTEEKQLSLIDPNPYPPDIAKLIEQHKGVVWAAEKYAGIPRGQLSKIRKGIDNYTVFYQNKVKAALEGKPIPKTDYPIRGAIADTCPPLLADLIKKLGAKSKATEVLRCSESTLYAVIGGTKPMPDAWIVRARGALGLPMIYSQKDDAMSAEKPPIAAAPTGPEFVPWDGKAKGIVTTKQWGKQKSRKIKNVPQPMVDLVANNEGIISKAAQKMGLTGGALTQWIEGKREFNLTRQKQVHAALHDLAPPLDGAHSMGEQFDKYTMGLAICFMKSANFDRISEIADILLAKMVFRKNTKAGWIIMYRMADEDLPKFKRLALRDAEEIVCP